MSERKRQVWLRPDQADLIVTMLKVNFNQLVGDHVTSNGSWVAAARYSSRRIAECIALVEGRAETAPSREDDDA